VALSYPLDAWWLRAYMRAQNVWWAFRRMPDRWYIHRRARVDRLMDERGFREHRWTRVGTWQVVLYRREAAREAAA
jgi:hypothetical protein